MRFEVAPNTTATHVEMTPFHEKMGIVNLEVELLECLHMLIITIPIYFKQFGHFKMI